MIFNQLVNIDQDLVNVLQHLDRDADGRLSYDEFAQGISRLGINLHEGELQVSCKCRVCCSYISTLVGCTVVT